MAFGAIFRAYLKVHSSVLKFFQRRNQGRASNSIKKINIPADLRRFDGRSELTLTVPPFGECQKWGVTDPACDKPDITRWGSGFEGVAKRAPDSNLIAISHLGESGGAFTKNLKNNGKRCRFA
jgi:hypothetical protein